MAERFKYEKRYKYPHMKPHDIAIWERCLVKFPELFDECEYDVPVGSGPEFDPTVSPETGGDNYVLYQRKIDVVGWKGEQLYIVEVKPRAGTSALGQVTGYGKLYERDYAPKTKPKLVVLTDSLLPDMKTLAQQFGVELIIV